MVFCGLTMPARGLGFNHSFMHTGGYTLTIASSETDRPDSDMILIFFEPDREVRKVVEPKKLDIDKLSRGRQAAK